MKVFAAYMIGINGFGLMLVPHLILSLFGIHAGDELFVRLVGLLAFIIGVNQIIMVKTGAVELVRASVWLRFFAAAFMVALVVLHFAPPALILFAFVDAAGAAWTHFALKRN